MLPRPSSLIPLILGLYLYHYFMYVYKLNLILNSNLSMNFYLFTIKTYSVNCLIIHSMHYGYLNQLSVSLY